MQHHFYYYTALKLLSKFLIVLTPYLLVAKQTP